MTRVPRRFLACLAALVLACPASAAADAASKKCLAADNAAQCRPALPLCESAVRKLDKQPPSFERDQSISDLYNQAGRCAYLLGQQTAAAAHLRRSLGTLQDLHGPDSMELAVAMSNLAQVSRAQGRYREAEVLLRKILGMHAKAQAPRDLTLADTLDTLGLVLAEQAKYAEAEVFMRAALKVREAFLGAEHVEVVASRGGLANVLAHLNRYDEAEPLFRQALERKRKQLGSQHLEVADLLYNFGNMRVAQGKYGEAELLLRESLGIRSKQLGREDLVVAAVLNGLALVCDGQGKAAAAEDFLRQSVAVYRKRLEPNHPDMASLLTNLAALLLRRGEFTEPLALLLEAARIRELQIRAMVNETAMTRLLVDLREEEEATYGLLAEHPDDDKLRRLALTTALLRKGRLIDAGAALNRLYHRNTADKTLAKLVAEWEAARAKHEALLFIGKGDPASLEYRVARRKLSVQIENLEAEIGARLPSDAHSQLPAFDAIMAQVAQRLPADGVLVEVVRGTPYRKRVAPADSEWGIPSYFALLLFADQHVEAVALGDAAQVDARVHALRDLLASDAANPVAAAGALFEQVMRPLLKPLNGRTTLFLSLDGTLNLIPFDALHDGADYLLSRYHFRYLASGRDLLRQPTAPPRQGALILANPDFGSEGEKPGPNGSRTVYQQLGRFARLPGTEREALAIAPVLRAKVLLAGQADEKAVRSVQAPWVLHIATHGLFLDAETIARPDLRPTADNGSVASGQRSRPAAVAASLAAPMAERMYVPIEPGELSRSALVLAGVGRGAEQADTAQDGLLTAQEASGLDLDGTQLVVLSACETGRGVLTTGQGVYGLRRAFLVAGAQTLVSSLWRVNDASTGTLIASYYQKLVTQRKSRSGAMEEAMSELRKKYEHPYYWAPFIVLGMDGPLSPPPPESSPAAGP